MEFLTLTERAHSPLQLALRLLGNVVMKRLFRPDPGECLWRLRPQASQPKLSIPQMGPEDLNALHL